MNGTLKIPVFSIELNSKTLTYRAGDVIEGSVHCNFKDKSAAFTSNKVLILEFAGNERTKWEVPDENSVNGEEYLEYGGRNDIIYITRVMHRFPDVISRSSSVGMKEELKEI